jgi:hypothetical protein
VIAEARRLALRAAHKRYMATPKGKAARDRAYDKAGPGRTRDHRAKIRAIIQEAKRRPCMDCGHEFDPVCMDLDHRPGEIKLFSVGSVGPGRSIEAVKLEIAKCDPVCACCHRLRTHRRGDHMKGNRRG